MMRILTVILCLALATPIWAQDAGDFIAQMRAERGLSALKPSAKLEKAAAAHAKELARTKAYSHKGANGSTPGSRAKRAGYRWCFVAENIAWGQRDVPRVMATWKASKGHYGNIIRHEAKEFGLARSGNVWVLLLGARRC